MAGGQDGASAPGVVSNTPRSTSSVTDLNSGQNVPDIPEEAYDGESPQWNLVAQAVQPTVVAIKVAAGTYSEAQGSGVIINSDKGYVVTNNHVVADAAGAIQIMLSDGRIFEAEPLGTDPSTDLAVLELRNPPSDLVEAELGNSDAVVVGEPVMAVGNPLGLDNTATTGIVSALNRPVVTEASGATSGSQEVVTNAIQVDAAVNPGNSGGPLFNAKGQVIGINSSIAAMPSESGTAANIGLAFAIPSNLVANVAGQLVENGVAVHPFLGVTANDTTVEIDGVTRAGAEIYKVEVGTPAEQVGLKKGDVIVAVDGNPVNGMISLTAWIRSYNPGDQVVLTVVQGGRAVDLDATLTTRES
ncbi:MAG: trypsin-like peptidase domain-containing protein [Bifidobacteriaceae bacterium]|nr:trypsin-like peptidase domain-containing protein [Bifidobacteriaceae bacterium]